MVVSVPVTLSWKKHARSFYENGMCQALSIRPRLLVSPTLFDGHIRL